MARSEGHGYKSGDPYLDLVGYILKAGIEDPWYYTMPCGRWWCSITGMDASALWKKATENTYLANIPYRRSRDCFMVLPDRTHRKIRRCL